MCFEDNVIGCLSSFFSHILITYMLHSSLTKYVNMSFQVLLLLHDNMFLLVFIRERYSIMLIILLKNKSVSNISSNDN